MVAKQILVYVVLLLCCLVTVHNCHSIQTTPLQNRLSKAISCEECRLGAQLVDSLIEINASTTDIIKVVADLCIKSGFEQPDVCEGILTNYVPIVLDVLLESELSPGDLCDYFKLCNSTDESSDAEFYHQNRVYRQKEIFTDCSRQSPKITPKALKSNSTVGYFLQITDIHFDHDYVVGSDPDCGRPLCCRNGTGDAGVWGNYQCDLPFNTVEAIFQHLSTLEDQLDFIIWTGDNPPHNVWDPNSKSNQIAATQTLSALVLKSFPSTPVFPSIGNHESFPSDEFYLPNTQWLLDVLYDSWEPWLDSDALQTVSTYGFYTSLVRDGLRLISLNTLDGDMINFYNLLPTRAVNQTAWFENVLQQAVANDEYVIIAGHIPCTLKSGVSDEWCTMYQQLVEEYGSIISAQIYGHTHLDQISVYTDTETFSKPIGVNYIAPSMTTYQNHEPGFRIYEYDYSLNQVTNYYQYHANISDANLYGQLNFTLSYSAKELYDMPDLTSNSWFQVANHLRSDDQMFNNYYNFLSNHPNGQTPCTGECRDKVICEIFGITSFQFDQCMGV
ncbi:sphingomyelinase [Tieghemostelium lacteum]|uniref:Sphingomyelin phosphodiesterase n=1 Tax=Tieghemostelium lacteum TaxID=361077 RepID=A0A151ZBN9_TIELA|nr:sphingomyelinase [Tieghemostelium lacteum]|eukprot:KYQ91360.1 sphingomyelinase [Tieghemostelium lacteum]